MPRSKKRSKSKAAKADADVPTAGNGTAQRRAPPAPTLTPPTGASEQEELCNLLSSIGLEQYATTLQQEELTISLLRSMGAAGMRESLNGELGMEAAAVAQLADALFPQEAAAAVEKSKRLHFEDEDDGENSEDDDELLLEENDDGDELQLEDNDSLHESGDSDDDLQLEENLGGTQRDQTSASDLERASAPAQSLDTPIAPPSCEQPATASVPTGPASQPGTEGPGWRPTNEQKKELEPELYVPPQFQPGRRAARPYQGGRPDPRLHLETNVSQPTTSKRAVMDYAKWDSWKPDKDDDDDDDGGDDDSGGGAKTAPAVRARRFLGLREIKPPVDFRVVHKPFIYLRPEPSTEAPFCGVIKHGEVLTVTAEQDGWLRTAHPTNAAKEVWALRDGAPLGLGLLLDIAR